MYFMNMYVSKSGIYATLEHCLCATKCEVKDVKLWLQPFDGMVELMQNSKWSGQLSFRFTNLSVVHVDVQFVL